MILKAYSVTCTFNFIYNSMKKIILILIAVFLTSNVYSHSTKGHTPNLDYNAGDTLFQYRKALTETLTMTAGIIPSVSIAFGTATAVGAAGNMTSDFDGTVSATLGMYGAEPDITVTIK